MESIADTVDGVRSLLLSLEGVWDEEAVDELAHARQAAAAAIADGADDEMVVAATLHDLAHSPTLNGPHSADHEVLARDWLTPRFGDRVGWLAGAHVAAKQYLVATEPGYGDGLSAVSTRSLAHQGGAVVDPALTAHPWWPDALRLRRYDDAAKDPAAPGADLADILVIVERVARQRQSS